MYCTNCGAQNTDQGAFCTSCGSRLAGATAARAPIEPGPDVRDYLAPSIIALVVVGLASCCFPLGGIAFPFGIVAIVYASQVSSKLAAGDYASALRTSNSARTWLWITLGIWVVLIAINLAIVGFAILSNPQKFHFNVPRR